jgi:spore maturation protein A
MLNKIWFGLLCIGILYGFGKAAYQSINMPRGDAAKAQAAKSTDVANANAKVLEPGLTAMGKRLNGALLEGAKTAVEICIGLIGIMALWLGVLNVAKDAGLIDAFARMMRPLMRWLFPEVPDGHPAQGAMLMNFSANMLGLDNAATPMGLKAMEELQTLNPVKDTATNSMATFLAINCGSITLIPFTIIGFRAIKGSQNPAEIIAGTLLASLASVVAGITASRWLARSSRQQIASEALEMGAPPDSSGSSEGGAG